MVNSQQPTTTPFPAQDYLSFPWRSWRLGGSLQLFSSK